MVSLEFRDDSATRRQRLYSADGTKTKAVALLANKVLPTTTHILLVVVVVVVQPYLYIVASISLYPIRRRRQQQEKKVFLIKNLTLPFAAGHLKERAGKVLGPASYHLNFSRLPQNVK